MRFIYYSGNTALTHNCLFNFIVGNRGSGKTFWAKEWIIKDFLKSGYKNQAVYARRYDTELKKRSQFFDDIKDFFPDHTFKVKGYEGLIDDKVAVIFISLSKSKIEKSTPFPNVNKIILDEFILDKGNYHYIPDEVTNFLELYSTVARTRDVRAFFLSNAITITNPYFLYFGVNVDGSKRFYKPKNDILVEFVKNQEFMEYQKKTRFGQLISGTKYSDYAIDNKMLRDSNTFIEKKNEKAKHFFTMIYKDTKYGVWVSRSEGRYYVSYDLDPNCKFVYAITQSDHSPNTMLLKGGKSKILKDFITNYQLGNVYFEHMHIKNIIYEIVRMALI